MSTSADDNRLVRLPEPALEVIQRRVTTRHRRRGWLLHRALLVADLVGLLLGFAVAMLVIPNEIGIENRLDVALETLLFAASLPLWIILAKLHGLYDQDEEVPGHSTVDDITKVFQVVTIGTWIFFVFAAWTNLVAPGLPRLTVFWAASIALIPLTRATARALCRRTAAYTQNAVIVGTGPVARLVARKIMSNPDQGVNLIGFVDATPFGSGSEVGPIPVLGGPEALPGLVDDLDVQRVVIAFTPDTHEETLELIRELRNYDVQVDIVPRMFEVIGTNSVVHMLEGIPLMGLPPLRLSPSARFLKRMLDVVGSVLGLAVLSPLLVAVAVAVRLDSRGPVFFRQVRRGGEDETFRIFKFRTMQVDADARKGEIAHLNMHLDGDPRMFKVPNDPRVTRVGTFLRRWSIDELPQLFNVLLGDMSLVGPRPLILEEDQHVERWARRRLELKPGMTGLWQVVGRSDIGFEEMTKLDYLYITSWSLKEDVRLILLTLPALFRTRTAY